MPGRLESIDKSLRALVQSGKQLALAADFVRRGEIAAEHAAMRERVESRQAEARRQALLASEAEASQESDS